MKIDIGCGSKKREGFIGLDVADWPNVDHVVNFEDGKFPFPDNSVDHVYSSHCFEHIVSPNNLWREISRVIKPGGIIEIWTPYPHHDDQWLLGHVAGWSRSRWRHVSSTKRAFYSPNFLQGGFWRWDKAYYCVGQPVRDRMAKAGIPLEVAVHHMVNVVEEWGCVFEYVIDDPGLHEPEI